MTAAIESYMLELRTAWADQGYLIVRIAQIETRLLAIDGILDVSETKINAASSNLILGAYQIPILGGITVNG